MLSSECEHVVKSCRFAFVCWHKPRQFQNAYRQHGWHHGQEEQLFDGLSCCPNDGVLHPHVIKFLIAEARIKSTSLLKICAPIFEELLILLNCWHSSFTVLLWQTYTKQPRWKEGAGEGAWETDHAVLNFHHVHWLTTDGTWMLPISLNRTRQ